MRQILRLSLALLLSFLAGPAPGQTAPATVVRAGIDEFLIRGNDFERRRLWQQAADLYERAVRVYPDRSELRERWQKAERLYSLSRRYHDPSFVHELLILPETQARELLQEVLQKIQTHYVDVVDLDRLVRLGSANLELALVEPEFISRNVAAERRGELSSLRGKLALGPPASIRDVHAAVDEVVRVGALCQAHGFQSAVPVYLEFLTAACEGLDPYCAHLTPNRLRDLHASIDGNFVGLGVEVRGAADGLEIVAVLDASPAAEAGLQEGDVITEVDGRSLAGQHPEEAANQLQGSEGSRVRLRVRSKGREPRLMVIARREVVVHSVTDARLLDPTSGIGYVRLNSFQKLTVRELEQAIAQLRAEGMRALVMDLRGNPGGLLDVAMTVANHFIESGVLVSTKGRAWGQSWSHRARDMEVWRFPVVVLVDGESASASEILAGAIKDHQRGLIVGTRTFGKGSVQSIFPLRTANTGLRLTTAYFYSPKGRVFHGVGVQPDIAVPRPLGPLGEEKPLPRHPDPASDVQLREALRVCARHSVR